MIPGSSHAQAVVIVAGACSGLTFGIFLKTRSEQRWRGINTVVNPVEGLSRFYAFRLIFVFSVQLLVVAGLMLLVGLGIMRLGGINRLDIDLRKPFGAALLLGAAVGKLVRYCYWRSR